MPVQIKLFCRSYMAAFFSCTLFRAGKKMESAQWRIHLKKTLKIFLKVHIKGYSYLQNAKNMAKIHFKLNF
jgi:hypothetical protein